MIVKNFGSNNCRRGNRLTDIIAQWAVKTQPSNQFVENDAEGGDDLFEVDLVLDEVINTIDNCF